MGLAAHEGIGPEPKYISDFIQAPRPEVMGIDADVKAEAVRFMV